MASRKTDKKLSKSETKKVSRKKVNESVQKEAPPIDANKLRQGVAGLSKRPGFVNESVPEVGSEITEDFLPETFDPDMNRNERILVPVDLQVHVVEDSQQAVFDLKGITDEMTNSQAQVGTRENGAILTRGIHLHWVMPDALMEGEEQPLGDENLEHDGMDSMFKFPELPDRWLVLRLWRNDGRRFNAKAWIVESDTQEVHNLEGWLPSQASSWLTAIDDLDPSTDDDFGWTATYHGSEGRFTFHDLPEEGLVGPFNYCVMGWYSRKEKDPLFAKPATTRGEWMGMLESLRWEMAQNEFVGKTVVPQG
jgi:hypothetical protein